MKKILVIDDDLSVQTLLGRFLKAANYELHFASDGLEGLEKTRALVPDLIIVDVNMPNLDGIALCRMVKNDPKLSHIPVLIITGDGTIGGAEDALKEAPDGFLTKPFDLGRLFNKIATLIN